MPVVREKFIRTKPVQIRKPLLIIAIYRTFELSDHLVHH